jgi:hypothetical protein
MIHTLCPCIKWNLPVTEKNSVSFLSAIDRVHCTSFQLTQVRVLFVSKTITKIIIMYMVLISHESEMGVAVTGLSTL